MQLPDWLDLAISVNADWTYDWNVYLHSIYGEVWRQGRALGGRFVL